MSHSIITVMPILADPEKLSKQELIEKCKEQQETLILQDQAIQGLCDKLAVICSSAHNYSAFLWALIDSFDANDKEAVEVQLRKMSDQRKSFQKAKVH